MIIGLLHRIAKNSLERPNIFIAIVFFLLPFVFSISARLGFGFPINVIALSINVGAALIFWIASVGLLYILIRLVKGAPALKFTGLLTGQSFIHLFNFILSVFVLALFLFLFPGFFGVMAGALQQQQFGEAELAQVFSQLQSQPETILLIGFTILIAVFVAVLLISAYLIYLLIEFAGQGSRKQNWLIFIAWLLIVSVVQYFLL